MKLIADDSNMMTPLDAERTVLTTEEGRLLLEEVEAVIKPGPSFLARWRQKASAEVVAAAIRLTESRRKGRIKFERADQMWLDPRGVEQATAEPVGRHKAIRFRDSGVVVDLCCGLGGDTITLGAEAKQVIAVDLDGASVARARWNSGVYEVENRVQAIRADATELVIPHEARVLIDPDRRVAGRARPAKMLADYHPNPHFLEDLTKRVPGGAIKLGPASDFDAHFRGPSYEIELISLGGECKEATVWFGDLTTCRRRATRLPEGATWTDQDGPSGGLVSSRPLGAYAFDPDPAILRSELLDSFAEVHGLGRINDAVDFLTGPNPVPSPFLTPFEVLDEFPIDVKTLRRALVAREIGTLEIKVRGIEIRPERLREQLRPQGPESATLLLVGGGRSNPARAVLTRRLESTR